ncbi:metal ABC transporter substrate-binding protein [Natronobiforma cellulositropha]|uniref:metal ABC transporter substrate-binding protein n=1 Tax=Natronobiforma cellulositropha TaxID=1679076 RepID=UPI003CCD0FA2
MTDSSTRIRSTTDRLTRRRALAAGGVLAASFAGCLGSGTDDDGSGSGDADITVFATMPAVWDFVRQVAGDHIDVIDLVPVGEHGHDWDPQPGIVREIEDGDGFVYLRDFSSWQDDAASQLETDGEVVVIEASAGIEFFDSPAEDNDEHWWMDPVECQHGVDNIADGLAEIDPDHADDYAANADAFNEELESLHTEFQDIVDRATLDELVVGTHDSFQWWHRRYGIDIHSPVGTSPDDRASPQDVREIETLIDEFGIEHVLYDVGEPAVLARDLADETDAEILPLSPVETQIDGSPEIDSSVQMDADWGYVDHFRELNFPSLEVALQTTD